MAKKKIPKTADKALSIIAIVVGILAVIAITLMILKFAGVIG